MALNSAEVLRAARDCGFELAGITRARPMVDHARYMDWVEAGMAAGMGYLADRRAHVRKDPRELMGSAESIVCVGKLYNGPQPYSIHHTEEERAWISRYAWGDDYHDVVREGLEKLRAALEPHESKICVDTAPLLERSCARDAGLGWIGKNTCLINQHAGSWFFLGELLTSLKLEPGKQAEDRCGTCTRCVEACPTEALVPDGGGRYRLDSRRCISYHTIESREEIPEGLRRGVGRHVFGCDICQDVCPWNGRAAMTLEPRFAPREPGFAPPFECLAAISEQEFSEMFRHSPVSRARYSGFKRNLRAAMENAGLAFKKPETR